jgi:hypothetical protein
MSEPSTHSGRFFSPLTKDSMAGVKFSRYALMALLFALGFAVRGFTWKVAFSEARGYTYCVREDYVIGVHLA